MAGYPWGGYSNGRIPVSALADYRGVLVRADAARQAYALQAAYQAATGLPLKVLEGYRDFPRQQKLRNLMITGNGNTAAVPGTSVHGWALAFDFAAPLNNANTSQHKWMRENAGRYGFDWNRGRADGEAWHWEYGNIAPTVVAGLGSTPIDNEDKEMPYTENWQEKDKVNQALDVATKKVIKNINGDTVSIADVLNALEKQVRDIRDIITPGIAGVKRDGVLYEQTKWSTEGITKLLQNAGTPIDAAELANRLAPMLVSNMSTVSDADLKRIAVAAADENARRQAN